jgi:hypothetical protein
MADTTIDGDTLKITAYRGEEILVTTTDLSGPKSQQCWWDGNQWVCSNSIIRFVPSDAEKMG